jgi:hypothetical protein
VTRKVPQPIIQREPVNTAQPCGQQRSTRASAMQAAQLDAMVLLHQQVCKSVATAQMRAVRTSGNAPLSRSSYSRKKKPSRCHSAASYATCRSSSLAGGSKAGLLQ